MLTEKKYRSNVTPVCPYCDSADYKRVFEQIYENYLDYECKCNKCKGVFGETWKRGYQSFDPVTKNAYQPEEYKEIK